MLKAQKQGQQAQACVSSKRWSLIRLAGPAARAHQVLVPHILRCAEGPSRTHGAHPTTERLHPGGLDASPRAHHGSSRGLGRPHRAQGVATCTRVWVGQGRKGPTPFPG